MARSAFGGRHELGQNFLTHEPTLTRIIDLVARTRGPILEIGAGDGALTRRLATLQRAVTAIDIDEHRVKRLQRTLPHVRVLHADAMRHPLESPVLVGNLPFHLTTPILRRILSRHGWQHAIVLTQWEVARKRAGVGGGTMMTAQAAPWFEFSLEGRVPSWGFSPRPSVDGGLLRITRRAYALVPATERQPYGDFVRAVFTGSGGTMPAIVQRAARTDAATAKRACDAASIRRRDLPKSLSPEQWASLWRVTRKGESRSRPAREGSR